VRFSTLPLKAPLKTPLKTPAKAGEGLRQLDTSANQRWPN
jgi:hypothetical protein